MRLYSNYLVSRIFLPNQMFQILSQKFTKGICDLKLVTYSRYFVIIYLRTS